MVSISFLYVIENTSRYNRPVIGFFIKGGTTWLHEDRSVEKDSAVVSKLRSCGAILLGKANMHELGMGTTGNNSNYG